MNNSNTKLICLDTETTGLSAQNDRIVEIGCVDITYGIKQIKTFQTYINPEREIPHQVIKIHGITNEKVADKPKFKEIAENFLNFIQGATLIIHNAKFDMKFLNAELLRCQLKPLNNPVIDTLLIAKSKFPGEKATLDALSSKFQINIPREKHGALLDSEILAHIYFKLIEHQTSLEHTKQHEQQKQTNNPNIKNHLIELTTEEKQANESFFNE